jgi:Peptidase M50B-like
MSKRKQPTRPEWQCAVCGYRLQYPVRDDLTHVAWHEAGHAVMRWRLGTTPGAICLHPDGSGFSAVGTSGQLLRRHDLVLITLAGIAAEVGRALILAASQAEDLDAARQLLTPDFCAGRFFPRTLTQEEALRSYYDQACTLIWEDFDIVEAVADALLNEGSLSSEDLQAMLTTLDDEAEEGD